MSKGVIYITTTSVTGLIKIGKTQTTQFESRMAVLEQNGYWNVNGLKRFFAVEVDDYDAKEKLLHTVFSKSQVASSELFALDKNLAKEMLMSFDGKIIFPYTEEKSKLKRNRTKSNLSFKSLGIPIGSILVFVGDESLCVKTVDNSSQVEYLGQVKSLSSMTRFLFEKIGKVNKSGAYQGGVYFKYNGRRLVDIRKEKEKSEV
jgi:hypothetical protein